jgi:hypothetical protein
MDSIGLLFLYVVTVACIVDAMLILLALYHWIEKYLP